jgi:hypothetical protein
LSHNRGPGANLQGHPVKPAKEYRKHVYWLTPSEAGLLARIMEAGGIRISKARGVVCTPLDERNRIAVVEPPVWSETCARPGSWYRRSDRNGLHLVISSFELEEFHHRKAALLTASDLSRPAWATREEKEEMIRDPAFKRLIPPEWEKVTEIERKLYLRWAARLGSDITDYAFLQLTHSANHANFLKPRFTVRVDGCEVPYSIDISAHVCSCCLELFQILGREHPKKLVTPCPGAVVFARLMPDRFLLVEKPAAGEVKACGS